ncbi:hypothetical protein [Rhodoferax antarcticus]|uniref:hypothetical protein n=1 Tax=Rhodoferax antarcticus TaxID=81479 RepID=UPI00111531DD|nr:hypothetical protein [Rhodoferax antarcticus]
MNILIGENPNGRTDIGDSNTGDFGDFGLDCNSFDDFSHEDFGGGDTFSPGSTGVQSADMGFSNHFGHTQGFDHELTDTENSIIQFARGTTSGKRSRTAIKKSEKIYITHEDFDEGSEQDAFLLIYGYASILFNTLQKGEFNENNLKQKRAIDFFFCRSIDGLHLQDAVACIDNEIRIDVLRLRFMLEFWMREWILPPMPSTADDLPSRVELMAAQYEGLIGVSLAREAWFEPGLSGKDLLERICDGESEEFSKKAHRAFVGLVDDYVLSVASNKEAGTTKVYVTGKNPILELEDKANDPTYTSRGRLANLYWSRKF